MRILLVSDFYPPQVGGMEQHVRGLAEELTALGHEVAVVCTDSDDRAETSDGVRVHRIRGLYQRLAPAFASPSRRYPPPLVDPVVRRRIAAVADQFAPDVLHTHGWVTYSALPPHTDGARPATVVTLHDYGFRCPKRTLLRMDGVCDLQFGLRCIPCSLSQYDPVKAVVAYVGIKTMSSILWRADRIIAVSRFVAAAHATTLPADRVRVVPNFYRPVVRQAPCLPEVEPELPDRFFLFVGVLAPFKGVDVLMEAYRRVRRADRGSRPVGLVILGRPEQPGRYASCTEEGIMVRENPPRSLVEAAYRRCLAVAVPSLWADPCPTVILEACHFQRPVIASALGGVPDLLGGQVGAELVRPGDPAALADAMLRASRAPRACGAQSQGALGARHIVGRIVRVYREALDSRLPMEDGSNGRRGRRRHEP